VVWDAENRQLPKFGIDAKQKWFFISNFRWPSACSLRLRMVFKIERITQDGQTFLRLSGRLNANELDQVRAEIGALDRKTSLDLDEIALVDMEAIRFLAAYELTGATLLHCPLYIREWINRERKRIS
jgi:hypothetical protein